MTDPYINWQESQRQMWKTHALPPYVLLRAYQWREPSPYYLLTLAYALSAIRVVFGSRELGLN